MHVFRFRLAPSEVELELDQFRQRQILVSDWDQWSARLPLFQRWLVNRGRAEIAMTAELESESKVARREEALRVTYEEAEAWASTLGTFRGEHVSADKVLSYLKQFGEATAQRRIFRLLERVNYSV